MVIPEGPDAICPRRALRRWMDCSPENPTEPLFHLGHAAFTRTAITKLLLKALSDTGYSGISGHSFRRGAATWAASIGLPQLTSKL